MSYNIYRRPLKTKTRPKDGADTPLIQAYRKARTPETLLHYTLPEQPFADSSEFFIADSLKCSYVFPTCTAFLCRFNLFFSDDNKDHSFSSFKCLCCMRVS